MAGQSIRRSQFLTTYGPGAILEGPLGPRIIPALDQSSIFTADQSPARFEIQDRRLSTALLNGAGIVRLPSNAELGKPETSEIYVTRAFPSWALCTRHNTLYVKRPGVNERKACPDCPPYRNEQEAFRIVRQQAIRFIRACPRGHLDDVDWNTIVHQGSGCWSDTLKWEGSGSSLKNIFIRCPVCNRSINLGLAYGRTWSCSGRFPELGENRPGCNAEAKIIQRGAANLRIPELVTALTIPPADTRLHRLLESHSVRLLLGLQPISSKQALLHSLRLLESQKLVGPALITELDRYNEGEILAAIRQMTPGSLPRDQRELRRQEFEALKRAAASGAPAQPSNTPGAPPQFEVIQNDVREVPSPGGHTLRITPVSRLRVVMVQTGYRRIDPLDSELVSVGYTDETDNRWYPGTELYGEGIFIDLAPSSLVRNEHFPLQGGDSWNNAWQDPQRYRQRLRDTEDRHFLHPVFVWWHTLSHRLINALSIDSGYSSAAVRERVYIDIDASGAVTGGLLLFTSQPGGDGTLGGMIALVPSFERVLGAALATLDACSNDPLCGDEYFRAGKYNGAACYACLLVSETSCEHRNTRLDRNLLLANQP